ncbi:membrane protein, partial [Pseudomonas syringae pv. actinidiae ICMP 18804]
STKDIGKVTYGLGYSFNLLMAVFVEAPWAIISTAKPLVIGGYDPGFDNDKCRLKKVVSPLAFLAGNDIMNWSVKTIASSPKEIMCAQFFLGVGHVAMLLFNLWVWWDLFTQVPPKNHLQLHHKNRLCPSGVLPPLPRLRLILL